jgi:hypothetical protein
MIKRVVLGGLVMVLAACGGSVGDQGSGDPVPLPRRDGDQGLYYAPKAGGPEHVADALGNPTALAMTNDRVVFTTRNTTIDGAPVAAGALYVANKVVGPALMIMVDRRGASFDALATDGATAFVATSDARILAAPVAGGASVTVAELDAPATALAVFGDYVYFATNAGALSRIPKKGGDAEPLATITSAIHGLEADDSAVYVALGVSEETPAGIVRVPVDGSKMTVLTSNGEPCAMIRDDRRLFWTSLGPASTDTSEKPAKGEVLRLSLDGGDIMTVASGAFSACAIAADKSSLYFATTVPGALSVKSGGTTGSALGLMRAPIGGGDPVPIAQASGVLARPGAVAVDATHVYWLTQTSVLRLAK